jgi:hypothetical protein
LKELKEKTAAVADLERAVGEKEREVAFRLQESNKVVRKAKDIVYSERLVAEANAIIDQNDLHVGTGNN